MTEAELASKLAQLNVQEQHQLLKDFKGLVGVNLAEELKKICYEAWLSTPEKTKKVISALVIIAEISNLPKAKALAHWGLGISEILSGQMRTAIEFFDKAENELILQKQIFEAAETQVGKLYALSMLGLYEEAIECGLRVRDVFLENKQVVAAGKIEHNIGNLYRRRDQYNKAEHFLRMARARFYQTNEVLRLIQSDNSLANALSHQHKFQEAEEIYNQALAKAKTENLEVTQAEIESNLGQLLIFQGRFDKALKYFESSRRRYEKMIMPHQSAIAEQEIADAYLELNLFPESAQIYENISEVFAKLELNKERAKTLSNLAGCYIALGKTQKAHILLNEAQKIYLSEKNYFGEATVKFNEAILFYQKKNYKKSLEISTLIEPIFVKSNFLSRALQTRWLRGESLRLMNENFISREYLLSALKESKLNFIPQITLRCLTSLGLLEVEENNIDEAESLFLEAIAIIEEMRTPLPGEDFRTSFLTDKLTSYNELVNLYLKKNDSESYKKAFLMTENARSRVLLEMISNEAKKVDFSESNQDIKGIIRLESLREELNWLYHQLNRLPFEEDFSTEKLNNIQEQIKDRENKVLEINRKQKILAKTDVFSVTETLDLEKLQSYLGQENVLIEYFTVGSEFFAFVISDKEIKVVKNLGNEQDILKKIESLRFQIDGLKTQIARKSAFQTQLLSRTQFYLNSLYKDLFQPLEKYIENKKIIIIPHKELFYLPFHALFDGRNYVIEKREVSYCPSAGVLKHCLKIQKDKYDVAVLFGVKDAFAPNINNEIETLAKLFPDSKVFLENEATLHNLKENTQFADVLHLACHGKFRPDNPLFSSLKLADEWLNVGDAAKLNLKSSLVVLSACETGINKIAAGDELLGLARGFLSAGASSLIVSFWQIDDETTVEFMKIFYEKLRLGLSISTSLRFAQIHIMQTKPHPFFWSPFILIGNF